MYCPKCLNDSLTFASKGVAILMINEQIIDSSKFLFDLNSQKENELMEEIRNRLNLHFKWYSNLTTKSPIVSINILTTAVTCDNGCLFKANVKFSLLEELENRKQIFQVSLELAKKHGIGLDMDSILNHKHMPL